MRKLFIVLFALSSVLLAGCNTVKGFGKDVEKVGEKIQGK